MNLPWLLMKTSKWYKTTAFRTITGVIFVVAGFSSLFQFGPIWQNLGTFVVSLVIAYFIFPKGIQRYILTLIQQNSAKKESAKTPETHHQNEGDDWTDY